jgi:hypothetical protein
VGVAGDAVVEEAARNLTGLADELNREAGGNR